MPPDALLDLVCGPASPLPETYQRYRLVAHLGSGGQADVYRAVRLAGGVSSAPMTVKVFRVDPQRPLIDELRSWDKGDAALMDLNNRGVTGICRRADGFYGPPPYRPGEQPKAGNAVPYQVYDYLHGVNLRDHLRQAAATPAAGADGRRLNAVAALRTLAGILVQMHHPEQVGACPVLHMDVKPSNVMVLTDGDVRLIDFTGARYWRSEEITQIAYTPESGGPEALRGEVGPPYDVHGFGAVAYFLVTGAMPRGGRGAPVVPGQHPFLQAHPKLRAHLLATLADRPDDRPATTELPRWADELADLVRQAGNPGVPVDWTEPAAPAGNHTRAVGRAHPQVTGTETDAYQRIEKLERALVELRGVISGSAAAAVDRLVPASAYAAHPVPGVPAPAAPGAPASGPGWPGSGSAPGWPGSGSGSGRPGSGSGSGWPGSGAGHNGTGPGPGAVRVAPGQASPAGAPASPAAAAAMRGRAPVVPPPPRGNADAGPAGPATATPAPQPFRLPTREEWQVLRRGRHWSMAAALFAFVAWGIWAAANRNGGFTAQLIAFVIVLIVALILFTVLRLLGWVFLERLRGGKRRSAVGAHLGTAVYLVLAGVTYLRQTSWLVEVYQWLLTNRAGH